MKIIISGSDKHYAIENMYCKYLNELGVDTKIFAGQSILIDFIEQSFINRVRNRLGLVKNVYAQISKQLEETIEQEKPDVVLVFKGMEILPSTIQRIKQRKIFIANYNPDHPFIFSGRGSGNSNVTKAFPHYDLHFCYSKLLMQQIENKYKIQTAFLPFGFELSQDDYNICKKNVEIQKVCFLGNPDVERVAFIKKLLQFDIQLTICGYNWEKYFNKNTQIELLPARFQFGYWQTLRQYRLQLNILRKHNVDSHNMRTFEVPAIGGIQLADDTNEHRLFFEPEKEIFLFKNIADCAEKIKFLLALHSQKAEEIRQQARIRSLQSDYSYKNRAKMLNDVVSDI